MYTMTGADEPTENVFVVCTDPGCVDPAERCRPVGWVPGDIGGLEWFCAKHAAEAGYCPGCGDFAAGTDSFERSGWCDTCWDDAVNDAADDTDDRNAGGFDEYDGLDRPPGEP